jgi:hypothetical protein
VELLSHWHVQYSRCSSSSQQDTAQVAARCGGAVLPMTIKK